MTYEPKTTGVRRLKHAIGAYHKRCKRYGKETTEDTQVCIAYVAAKEATAEFDELHKQKVLLEDAGNRLWNHLSLLPPQMFTQEMKYDLERWNSVLMNNERNQLKIPSINK